MEEAVEEPVSDDQLIDAFRGSVGGRSTRTPRKHLHAELSAPAVDEAASMAVGKGRDMQPMSRAKRWASEQEEDYP